ncbi:hypothetical protein V3C99_003418 [Haemonchus contortus]
MPVSSSIESSAKLSENESASQSLMGNKGRGNWGSQMEFLLATIGLTVGLGNVWRFPALAYNNGGSAFLFPYFICAVFFGLPSLYLEMLVGQYMNCGPSMLFRHYLPALQGLGWSMTLISLTVSIYYCVIIAWGFLYLYSAATGQMPKWGSCYNSWNDIYCTDEELMKECARKDPYHPIAFNGSCIAMVFKEMKTPFDQYFTNVVTKRSDGIDQIGDINWPTLTALAVMWTTVILILVKGYEYMGKVAYVTSTVPYVIIVVLFVRGITLEGASEGVYYYLGKPDFNRLLNHETWSAALVQICFSLNVGYGGIIVLASYNAQYNNCYRDAWLVIWGVLIMSVFGGVAVFATLGYLSHQLRKPIDEVVSSGLSLAFVAYPEAMSKMPYPSVWASCFFAMLFCLGISSEVAFAETICTNIYDQWPYTRKFKWFVSLCTCVILFVCGVIMTTESGFFWFTVFDSYCASTSACVVIVAEVLVFIYVYGFSNIRQDAREMFGEPRDDPLSRLFEPAAPLWAFCWKFVTPAMGLIIMVFTVMRDELTVEHRSKTYTFPGWALGFGWFLSLVPLVPIPIYFVANVIEWKRHGRPLKTLFTIQPSLVSYKRIHGLAEYGILPKDYESSRSSTISSSISSTSSSSIRSDRKTVESAESDR